MKLLRFISKEIINSFGYEVRRVPRPSEVGKSLEMRMDPITSQYMPRMRGSAVLDIPLKDARGLNCLGLKFNPACHPFVKAATVLREAGVRADAHDELRAVLEEFYASVQPASALEAVGLDVKDAPLLQDVQAAAWIFPWADKSISENLKSRQTSMRFDALQYRKVLSLSEGITAFGPVGPKKLALEVERIQSLTASISESGFGTFNRKNPLKVVGLRRGEEYRWLVIAGHHRFSACAAFSIEAVPAIVTDVIRYEDCRYWPQVVSGVYTERGARTLFDRLYEGVPAPVCANWIRKNTMRERPSLQSQETNPQGVVQFH